MKIALTRAAFIAAASVVQAKNDVRYYLNGILIERAPDKGLLIVATDGHRLVAALDEDAEFSDDMPEQVIIQFSAETLRAAKQAKNLDNHVFIESIDVEDVPQYRRLSVNIGNTTTDDSKTIDGKFPDWRRICKASKAESSPGWFNASYVADFEKVARFLNESRKRGLNSLTIRSDDANTAALVYFGGVPYAFGVVMPMRTDITDPQLPTWAFGPFKAAKAA